MAISVGNVHLMEDQAGGLDEGLIAEIDAATDVPLVIHGGSGVPSDQRRRLARETAICKFNIGTELRAVFGKSLRDILAGDEQAFDRVAILKQVEGPIEAAARAVLRDMRG